MPIPASALKKSLVAEGFEIYRTSPNFVVLADRVRNNLLMDSGVAVVQEAGLGVRIIVRAQALDFPGTAAEVLFELARTLAGAARERGYSEVQSQEVRVQDPGDPDRTLDTWYEVTYHRGVASETELFEELRFALAVKKTAEP
jgi:hypothetical protein